MMRERAKSCQQVILEDIEQLRGLWKANTISKHQFAEAMHRYHRILFTYSRLLRDNPMESFTITALRVEARTQAGVRFACDPEDVYSSPLWAFSFGEIEGIAGDMLKNIMPERGIFFDIGANVGWYCLHIARRHPQSQVYAFEPLPPTYDRLKRNIALNGLTNIQTFNIGLAERNDTLEFYFRPDKTGAASIQNITECADAVKYSCSVRRMDDVWREIDRNPDLIKCDVEGAELLVFRGGRACLAETHPIIFCEMLRKWSAKFNYHPNDLIIFFSELGYACFEPTANGLKVFEHMTDETQETNFFFLHKDKHETLIRRNQM
jgi:FkbM family methyltransferase